MYLLDTNVVSELRKASRAHPNVQVWARQTAAVSLYLSVISVLELELGVLLAERRDPPQGARLRRWLEGSVLTSFENRLLPIDATVARHAARLHVPNPRPERDCLIAACALVHGLTVVTRNEADFRATGAPVLNPWR